MERELWSWISEAIKDVGRTVADTNYHTYSTTLIIRVYLWAVLHDRPVSWACNPDAWSTRTRPDKLPSQSTLSRRLREQAVQDFLHRMGSRLSGELQLACALLKIIDGKPLLVSSHSQDRHATWAGRQGRGYKLHVISGGKPMPEAFLITPLNEAESSVAREMIPMLKGGGYIVGDANYDDNSLYELAAAHNHRFVAPRRRPGGGICPKTRFHPHRIRAMESLERMPFHQPIERMLVDARRRVETVFGNLTSFYAGLTHLPPWVRGLRRVRQYTHAKLLINAARIRANHA